MNVAMPLEKSYARIAIAFGLNALRDYQELVAPNNHPLKTGLEVVSKAYFADAVYRLLQDMGIILERSPRLYKALVAFVAILAVALPRILKHLTQKDRTQGAPTKWSEAYVVVLSSLWLVLLALPVIAAKARYTNINQSRYDKFKSILEPIVQSMPFSQVFFETGSNRYRSHTQADGNHLFTATPELE